MSNYANVHPVKKGFGDFHNWRSNKIISHCYFGESALRQCNNCGKKFQPSRSQTLPKMQRSEMVCFDEPFTACQNRYWVNTTLLDTRDIRLHIFQMQEWSGLKKRIWKRGGRC